MSQRNMTKISQHNMTKMSQRKKTASNCVDRSTHLIKSEERIIQDGMCFIVSRTRVQPGSRNSLLSRSLLLFILSFLRRVRPMSLYDEKRLLKKLQSLSDDQCDVQIRRIRRKLLVRQVIRASTSFASVPCRSIGGNRSL